MRIRLLALPLAMLSAPVWAQSTDDKIEELQKKVEALDQRVKVDEDAAQTNHAAAVSADTTGFKIRSNDGNFVLKIGADLQVDNRTFVGTGSASLPDTILLRRVRPTFSGTIYKYVDFFFRPDFGQGQTVIYDAYLELKYFSAANLRVGKFKPPVGL